ncbi:MAG TPA: Maf family protein [Spirochaetota bacterium]|jgi:septum formation protein|nr:Maf family protein [Spirochaetota bacterium]HQO22978.1 Maf family protein [Spirochaetota bacterium]HQQ23530.1 Maf family protein [Spirochaetota bacterium]
MKVFLGSASPRRKDILSLFVKDFEILKPSADESVLEGESPEFYSMRIGIEKCLACLSSIKDNEFLLITSDTIVALDDIILGKPKDKADAIKTLQMLSGKTHRVISSLTLHFSENSEYRRDTQIETTFVKFKTLSSSDIETYITNVNCMDKAGSYAIQEMGSLIIDSISGSHSSVVGFPSGLFFRMLFEMNIAGRLLSL